MKKLSRKLLVSSVIVGLMGWSANEVSAQTPQTGRVQQAGTNASRSQTEHSHDDHVHGKETIAFQLAQWKTMHFEDAAKAKQHGDMVKKLGCEIKQGQHAGHIDVSYRCAEWRTLVVDTHELADQWTGWLKGSGFDVSHTHPDASYAEGNEVVEFRLVNWKSIHGSGGADEKELISRLKKLGCEVVVSPHAGHSDIKYRAPTWRDAHLTQHAAADDLGKWLKKYGFEVAPHKH